MTSSGSEREVLPRLEHAFEHAQVILGPLMDLGQVGEVTTDRAFGTLELPNSG